MFPFGVNLAATVPQRSEIREGLMNYLYIEKSVDHISGIFITNIWGYYTFRTKGIIFRNRNTKKRHRVMAGFYI